MSTDEPPPIVKCFKHGRSCCIKTGTNPNSVDTYKKSFYVCAEKPQCDFNRLEKGHYYCCNVGYKETGKFCGNNIILEQISTHLEDEGSKEKTKGSVEHNHKATVESHTIEKPPKSFDFSSLSLEMRHLEEELLKKKKVVAVSNLSVLPDGGAKIKEQIVQLESAITKLSNGLVKPQSNPAVHKSVRPTIIHPPNLIPTFEVPSKMANIRNERAILEEAISGFQDSLKSKPKDDEEENDPIDLVISLVQHQRRALSWLLWREKQHPSGGILADDMGLGKTLTMIALILKTLPDKNKKEGVEWLSKESSSGETKKLVKSSATLVICPASLLYHWDAEVKLRCRSKAVKVHVYFGLRSKRNNISTEKLASYDMIVTTYDTVRSEITTTASSNSLLEQIEFRRIILDEGHTIKNPKSQISMAVCNLNAKSRWVVSGTPIHNNLTDIYSLLRFLRCTPFDDFVMWKRYVDTKSPLGKRWLGTIVSCMLLRRTKTETDSEGKLLVCLPPKTIHQVELLFTKEESDIYRILFNQSKEMMRRYLEDRGEISGIKKHASPTAPNNSGLSLKEKHNKGSTLLHILVTLLRLRQCCCHPSLLCEIFDVKQAKNAQSGDDLLDGLVSQMEDLHLTNPVSVVNDLVGGDGKLGPTFDMNYHSTKIKALLSRLDHKGKDSPPKSVVVSQWTSMLNIVAFHLKQIGMPFCQISGDVAVKDRMHTVESFNGSHKGGPQVMLLSLKAGGVGLNLVGGSNLFIMDLHWNPALECQAIDRVYRMGQTRDVHVYRFICKDTIEVKIASLQDKKLSLAKSVVEGGKGGSNTVEQLRALFGF